MSQYQLLNNVKHKDLKILTRRGADVGDAVSGCVVYPTELNELQKHYPVVFQKQDDGSWLLIALFGFENNENLFLENDIWNAPYIPAVIEREPFLIGFQERQGQQPEPVVHVDLNSPRISKDGSGEAVFLEYGGNAPFLSRVTSILTVVHEGVAETERMLKAFIALDLIAPFSLEMEFENSTKFQTSRYATIDKEKLLTLSDEQVGQLHRSGLLRYAYLINGSMSNMQHLVNVKNSRLRQGR
ncbi:SapC family protein [Cellvibrio polysaccharolyticus]|uniref:Multidrug transporter n=1 Tax=Cellvibrio polysaccharolyticus TaxID=2082724 RepID=A0A928YUG8_9GAMM|nr:SapC family protein [Cellvibrio polysaccharolyticus]MBE8717942.1 multidrug transporter [Cellvibrio polysaccharolyticus]